VEWKEGRSLARRNWEEKREHSYFLPPEKVAAIPLANPSRFSNVRWTREGCCCCTSCLEEGTMLLSMMQTGCRHVLATKLLLSL
jgi:hypothetical protein